MENFWIILLVAIGIACFVTRDWYERILMIVFYAVGLLVAVHIDGWGWKLLYIFVVTAICKEDDNGEMFTPSHVVACTIVAGMILYTVCGKWLNGFGIGLAGIITTLMSIAVVISAKK